MKTTRRICYYTLDVKLLFVRGKNMSVKKTAGMLLAVVMTALSFMAANSQMTAAADNISVYINNELVAYDVQPKIIYDRTMVPFRLTCEKLGAQVGWNEEAQRVTMLLDDKYAEVIVGNSLMVVADAYITGEGQLQRRNQQLVELEAPPVIVESRLLVPLRAIAEALGAKVSWITESRSVMVSYEPPSATAPPTPSPIEPTQTPEPTRAVSTPFDSNANFQVVEGSRLESFYDRDRRVAFIVYYYNGNTGGAADYMPMILAAAREVNTMVLGVDTTSSPETDKLGDWFWKAVGNVPADTPALLFVTPSGTVETVINFPKDQSEFTQMFVNWLNRRSVGPAEKPTPTPETPFSHNPEKKINDSRYINYMTQVEADRTYNSKASYILLCYDPNVPYSDEAAMDTIIDAINEAKVRVYIVNVGIDENTEWFMSRWAINNKTTIPNPFLLFLDKSSIKASFEEEFIVKDMVEALKEFDDEHDIYVER